MEEEIKSEFSKIGFSLENEEEILKKCLTFCINYSLKPSDIVSSWEVYYLNRQLDESIVKNEEMEGFLLHLQNEQKEAIVKEESDLHVYSSKDVDMILNDEEEDLKEGIFGTPMDKSLNGHLDSVDLTPLSTGNGYYGKKSKYVTPFGQRTSKFVVKFNINNLPATENGDGRHVDENPEEDIIKKVQPRKRCSLVVHECGPEQGCRFMYDRTEDRFNALDSRIRNYAAKLVASGLYEEPTDPTVASLSNVFAVGMVCCDGEGRLNDKSIMLQSSVEHSGGNRVRLDLQKLPHFSIFPGQVLGVEGRNPSGHCLIATKIVDSVPIAASTEVNPHPSKKQALNQDDRATYVPDTEEDISVLMASGPFTTTDNLLFEPLSELLSYASRNPPQLLVLLGPFIDSEHPEIKKGTIDGSFDEIFRLEILRRLQDHVEYMGSGVNVIIVPSLRDANHDPVFPQPAFDIHLQNLKHQITSLTNPGIFKANQVKVGCCTADVLKQLSSEEMSRNAADGPPSDRMSRIASHILNQRSFYPLYPPAEEIPLDFSLAPEALHITSIPDILILPSDMKYFVKVVTIGGRSEGEDQRKCICINPGRLAKGEGGGTFAELNYQGSPDKINASIIGI